jgi:single-strand DNA-binding protein
MAGETVITVVGNITDDPELRFTPSGAAVANFTVASTPRTLNKQTNEWEDGEAMFLRCSIWRQAAENVAESLQKGARVIVNGRMRARTWEDREGNKRTSFEIDVEEIGPSLKFATAKVVRAGRSGGGGGGSYSGGGGGNAGGYSGGGGGQGGQSEDPWSTPAPSQGAPSGGQGGGGQGGGRPPANDPWAAPGVGSDEPPF